MLYFVHYTASTRDGGTVQTNAQLERDKPVVNIHDINDMHDALREIYRNNPALDLHPNSIVISNWRRFEDAE